MKVLIGYDGSESGDAVFKGLERAGLPPDSEAVVASVGDFKSGFERFRLDSVSTAVVTGAHCSVEIVRPSEIMQ